ncbi:MAG: hypothetical protein IJ002_04300 [Clostridia bacterium]|nr:hypothetical protein [Clostridia bacterium]
MKKSFPAICQNNSLCERIAEEISDGRFPHAYIIAGAPGSGKRTIAINIAAALACKDNYTIPCGNCDSCQKILNGFSPDVFFIRKDADKKEFTVNLIRDIKESLYIAPNELDKRVYIIEEAETMNLNAQNAFLKMLEEPPEYVVFLLLCSNTENLLDTIKSRAPILYTEHISPDNIKAHLLKHSSRAKELFENSPEKLDTMVLSANGSIGLALSLCEESDKHLKLRSLVTEFLNAWTSHNLSELDLFCDTLPNDADTVNDFLSTLTVALRDIAVSKCDQNGHLLFFSNFEEAEEFALRVTTVKALKLIETANALKEKIKFYIDIRLAAVTFCGDARKIMIG